MWNVTHTPCLVTEIIFIHYYIFKLMTLAAVLSVTGNTYYHSYCYSCCDKNLISLYDQPLKKKKVKSHKGLACYSWGMYLYFPEVFVDSVFRCQFIEWIHQRDLWIIFKKGFFSKKERGDSFSAKQSNLNLTAEFSPASMQQVPALAYFTCILEDVLWLQSIHVSPKLFFW